MAAAEREEISWVREALAGDAHAFRRLYERFGPLVHGVLLARVARQEVEDLVQEVFVVAFEKLASLRDPAAFGAWVATIARTRAVDHGRASHASVTDGGAEEIGREDPATLEAKEALAAIRRLPEAYRETLVLRLVEGMTGPEIAERTGLTPDSVRVNLHRGMTLLREALGEER